MSSSHDRYAGQADTYDSQSLKYQWHGPAILFGLMYPDLRPGETVLDLGIGTGLGALSFHKAGLNVIGIDNSAAMIEKCKSRDLNWTVHRHDLTNTPWPLRGNSVDHVVTAGVTHFIGDLGVVMNEVARVMKHGGLFGFDFYEYDPESGTDYVAIAEGIYSARDEEYDLDLYRHTASYVWNLLSENGFAIVHDTEFLASHEPRKLFRAMVARNSPD